jgi:SnoaL-like domain
MDTQVMSNRWSRDELERAHANFIATANRCAESGEWENWANLFTEDARYVEHMFGEFNGREEIHRWIADTMAQWPNKAMTSFPHTWCVCDEEKGWWVCRIENRFRDPGDGSVHQAHNITVLQYAGDMQFSSEEDAYNPANFGPVVVDWMAAYAAHGGEPY